MVEESVQFHKLDRGFNLYCIIWCIIKDEIEYELRVCIISQTASPALVLHYYWSTPAGYKMAPNGYATLFRNSYRTNNIVFLWPIILCHISIRWGESTLFSSFDLNVSVQR